MLIDPSPAQRAPPSPETGQLLLLSNETGFKTLYLLSRPAFDGVVYGDGKSATPPFQNSRPPAARSLVARSPTRSGCAASRRGLSSNRRSAIFLSGENPTSSRRPTPAPANRDGDRSDGFARKCIVIHASHPTGVPGGGVYRETWVCKPFWRCGPTRHP